MSRLINYFGSEPNCRSCIDAQLTGVVTRSASLHLVHNPVVKTWRDIS